MEPIAAQLRKAGARKVFLIPRGRLSALPLHAATYQVEGKESAFLDEFIVAYSPSARALALARRTAEERKPASWSLVGGANPQPVNASLPWSELELEVLRRLFPAEGQSVLYGREASRAALLRNMRGGSCIHLACHGTFNYDRPLDSYLNLGGSTNLSMRDFFSGLGKADRARLVVLSACDSAHMDTKILPDEFIGFPASLMQNGIPAVLGTLWRVDDASTALLMGRLYQWLLSDSSSGSRTGMGPGDALRRAQLWIRDVTCRELCTLLYDYLGSLKFEREAPLSMLKERFREYTNRPAQDRPFSDPYYWAPFVLYGILSRHPSSGSKV
jgi:CHAT domain-containing protein